MGNFFAELRRRHLYRVGAAYAVVAWVLLQLVNNVAPVLELPPWIARAILLLLFMGFPIVLLLAWVVGTGPDKAAEPAGSTPSSPVRANVDWVLAGALAVVIALVSYQQLAPSRVTETADRQQASVAAARAAAATPASALSIAVLPFANVSGDPSQEFFSDGMTDEITGALTKISDLRVVGRTSAFQFKGQTRDLRAIGQTLGATHLIDGSVRKAGNRVRISVQLIKADDGVNVWGDSYDRDLTDVFTIQEDIARAVATSLRMPLGLAPGENLVSNRTKNLETYQDFLKGKAWLRARLSPASGPYLKTFESVVARDPGFAPAWALLARAYSLEPGQTDIFYTGSIEEASRFVKTNLDKGEMAARKAIELDPESPGGYSGMAFIASNRGQWAVAGDNANKALALDPNDPEALVSVGQGLLRTGYLRRSLENYEKLHALEPLVPGFTINAAHAMRLTGQSDAAIALLESMPASVGRRNLYLARAYAAVGRYEDAADTVLLRRATDAEFRKFLEDAAKLLRSGPKPVALPKYSPAFVGEWNFIYAPTGAFERVMDYAEYQLTVGYPQDIGSILWQPEMAPLRKTARFKAHMRKVGLVDYWKARGWPDLCRPMGADDFVCD